ATAQDAVDVALGHALQRAQPEIVDALAGRLVARAEQRCVVLAYLVHPLIIVATARSSAPAIGVERRCPRGRTRRCGRVPCEARGTSTAKSLAGRSFEREKSSDGKATAQLPHPAGAGSKRSLRGATSESFCSGCRRPF